MKTCPFITEILLMGCKESNKTKCQYLQVFEFRLHKNKVTHVEFSPREDWLLCTASTDSTVQLWDVRMLKDRKSSLAVLKHERPVNSGKFVVCKITGL